MEIIIQFVDIYNAELQRKEMANEEFFDPLDATEQEEGYHIMSSYKYQDDYWRYIDKTESELRYIQLVINDSSGKIEDTYAFWNEGKNWIRTYFEYESAMNKPYHSITVNLNESIIESRVEKSTMLKFSLLENRFWAPIMHNVNLADQRNLDQIDIFHQTGFTFQGINDTKK